MAIKAIDFFCGAGGLTRGLLDAGIQVLAGVDQDIRLKETYEANNRPARFIGKDIRTIDIVELRRELRIDDSDVVLYAACTPCQPFSTLTQMKGEDKRKVLLLDFAELVKVAPPDFVLVENVPGLNTAYGRDVYEQFAEALTESGIVDRAAASLDAADFGVPQVRKRFILLGSRHGPIELPSPDTGGRQTVRMHIARFPTIEDGAGDDSYVNHVARKLYPHHRRIVQAVPKDGGSRSEVADKSILLQCHQKHPNVHKDVFGRMAWDAPAPTLTGRCVDVYCGRFVHPEQDRGISLREAAALQTFPDDYEFIGGSLFFLGQQVGNAVPVKLGERLGESILEAARWARLA